jgi:hypothetical protein
LEELYDEGDYDFLHISLVDDKCTHAANRIDEFNLYGFPTVYFDGGYQVKVGAYQSVPQQKTYLLGGLNPSLNRAVEDIDIVLDVKWLGDATMEIAVTVQNNEATTYGGTIRVYVTEIETSFNWKDSQGKPYQFPFLDYAFNETISVPASGSWSDSVTWVGANHNNGKGTSYGTITSDNITVMAVVYNDEWHQGYSNPPTGYPFDAYYVDDSVASVPATLHADTYTVPEAGGTVNLTLATDPDHGNRNYLILGGTSGSYPGYALPVIPRLYVPVNWDWFTDLEMTLLNTSIFHDFMGQLGADGMGSAQLNVPPVPPGTAGVVMTFAFCMNNPFNYVSTPMDVEIVP